MPADDLREWIALLEREGELVRVQAAVDPHLEVTEIVTRTVRMGGPALLFEHPKGSDHALLVNQFGTERRMCLALGVERLDTERYGELFRGLLERGVYVAPSQYECLFPSLAHGEEEIQATISAVSDFTANC